MASNAPTSRTCCPLVFVVPAALPQGSIGAQPGQMFMVAPMNAPVNLMMPQFQDSYGSQQADISVMPSNLASAPYQVDFNASYPWAAESVWQPFMMDKSMFGEEAPQQLPMNSAAPQELPYAEPHCEWASVSCQEVEVPTQIHMDSTTFQKQGHKKGTGTLRRRRGEEYSTNESCGFVADTRSFNTGYGKQDIDTDVDDAQAQEIAGHMIEQLQTGGNAQMSAVASFERLAFTSKVTSRAAQIILQQTSMTDAAAFATGLRGHVRSAVQSKHANHVVQKITEVMPVARASFIVDELRGFGQEVARHCFGCRVLCRILEHLSPNDSSTVELVEEVFTDLDDLLSHSFGSFVVRHLLEFGLPNHRHRVVEALRKDLSSLAKDKFGSHVVEAALRHSSPDDQKLLVEQLLANKEQLVVCAANQFGRHVVRALLEMPGNLKKDAVKALRPSEGQLKSSRYGKSVLQALRAAASV